MDAMAGTVTEEDFRYLFEKAGYGFGQRERTIMDAAVEANGGVNTEALFETIDNWLER